MKHISATYSLSVLLAATSIAAFCFLMISNSGPSAGEKLRSQHGATVSTTHNASVDENGRATFQSIDDSGAIANEEVNIVRFQDGSPITDEHLKLLLQLENIESLSVGYCSLPPNFPDAVNQMTHLKFLGVSYSSFDDSDLKQLENCTSLKSIFVVGSKVTNRGIMSFKSKRPDVGVTSRF